MNALCYNFIIIIIEKNISKINYTVSGWRRIIARLLDLVVLSTVSFIVFLLVNIETIGIWKSYFTNGNLNVNVPLYQFLIQMIFFIIINPVYFILLPKYFNGRTIGKFICKIRIVSRDTDKKINFKELIKHELFITQIFPFIILIVFIILLINKNYNLNIVYAISNSKIVSAVINSFYFGSSIIISFLIINLILSKSGINIHDKFSNTLVITTQNIVIKKQKNNLSKSLNMSGKIKEIEKILDNEKT